MATKGITNDGWTNIANELKNQNPPFADAVKALERDKDARALVHNVLHALYKHAGCNCAPSALDVLKHNWPDLYGGDD